MPNPNEIAGVNLDEFLPMPGAEDILTGTDKNNVFSKAKEVDTAFLEDPKKEEVSEDDPGKVTPEVKIETNELLDGLTKDDDLIDPSKNQGRPKVDKSGLVDTFSKLIDDGLIVPFEDDKKMEDYSLNDWKELIQANFEERERKIKEEVPASFFESLPHELKYAAKYVLDGGQDLKGLFRALSHVEEVRQLDVNNEQDQEMIARSYLRVTNFGTEEEIDEEITTWKDLNTLNKKAAQFKPKLDKLQQENVAHTLRQQELFKKQQQEASEQFMDNVYNTLKAGELNGVKLDKKTQAFLFTELTQPKYQSIQGRNTNLLGHLLEKYQFVEPRYDLIAEALWLLSDPDGYKTNIKTVAKSEAAVETVRKLKTEEGRKLASNQLNDDEPEKKERKGIPRQQNIFKRS